MNVTLARGWRTLSFAGLGLLLLSFQAPIDDAEKAALERARAYLAGGGDLGETHDWTFNGDHCYGTLLHRAVVDGHLSVVELLVGEGADVGSTSFDVKGEVDAVTPLALAARLGDLEIAGYLVEHGADPAHREGSGSSPLFCAARWGRGEMARFLLEKGAPVNPPTEGWITPLHAAAGSGHILIAELLLEKGADASADVEYRGTPLQMALSGRNGALATLLILRGARVTPGKLEENPLADAARIGDRGLVELMIDRGALLNVPGEFSSALHAVIENQELSWQTYESPHLDVASLLLRRGAEVNARGGYGKQTPLHLAFEGRDRPLIHLLLDHGADPDARDAQGRSPLHMVWSAELVRLLIEHGADTDVRDERGRSPLHAAAAQDQSTHILLAIVQALLRGGADPQAVDGEGKRPADLARDAEVRELLGGS